MAVQERARLYKISRSPHFHARQKRKVKWSAEQRTKKKLLRTTFNTTIGNGAASAGLVQSSRHARLLAALHAEIVTFCVPILKL